MTDEQIIKALDCCFNPKVTEECPRKVKGITCNDSCERILVTDALDLINRQKAEIERLEGILNRRCDVCPTARTATIKHNSLCNTETYLVQENIVKKFAEKLKSKATEHAVADGMGNEIYTVLYVGMKDIDDTVEEIIGGSL